MKELMGKKTLAVSVIAVLIAAAVVVGLKARNQVSSGHYSKAASVAQVAYDPPPIVWAACQAESLVSVQAECGYLEVPLDYDKPDGTKIQVAVSRVRHQSEEAKYQGIMLVNPGGPGGPGLTLSTLGGLLDPQVTGTYDWIGFDPRGVGSSQPALTCNNTWQEYNRPDYVPDTQVDKWAWLTKAKAYAKDCAANGGELLDHVKTTDNVKDMDALRKALGQEQINLFGISYGSYLGQVYSTMYPGRMRRMVLDGIIDPGKTFYQLNDAQQSGAEHNIESFFAWVAKNDSTYKLGSTAEAVEDLYYEQLAALDDHAAGENVGSAEWTDIFQSAATSVRRWLDVAGAFSGWVHDHDWQALKTLYEQTTPSESPEDNLRAMYLATACTDMQWPTNWTQWEKDGAASYARAPFFTWGNIWWAAPCVYWPAKAGTPVKVDGSKAPAALLVNETYDSSTPYAGALEVRSRFPRSVLIEGVGGTSHGGALYGNACIDDAIVAYLDDGTLPERVSGRTSDKQCAPSPQPDPEAAVPA